MSDVDMSQKVIICVTARLALGAAAVKRHTADAARVVARHPLPRGNRLDFCRSSDKYSLSDSRGASAAHQAQKIP